MAGMIAQQITWAEINAYSDARLASLSAWDKLLIRRLDDAYEAARPENAAAKKKTPSVAETKAALRAQIAARNARAAAQTAAKGAET